MRKSARLKEQRRNAYESHILNNKFALTNLKPMTQNQKKLEELYAEKDVILAIGSAGTGKTFYSAFLALRDVFVNEKVDRIIYLRTAVQTRDQGFMPGDVKEKMQYYEAPMIDAVNVLINDLEAYSVLKRKKTIEFMSTTFIRGITLDNAVIIFDECQCATEAEISSVITRMGQNTKIVLCGDTKQDDLKQSRNKNDISGLPIIKKILSIMPSAGIVEFTRDDIVRSGVVKEFIIASEELELMS